jgi:hypothetical protein
MFEIEKRGKRKERTKIGKKGINKDRLRKRGREAVYKI